MNNKVLALNLQKNFQQLLYHWSLGKVSFSQAYGVFVVKQEVSPTDYADRCQANAKVF
jgi:hypothetical protein